MFLSIFQFYSAMLSNSGKDLYNRVLVEYEENTLSPSRS
jgi:hypothetical protein